MTTSRRRIDALNLAIKASDYEKMSTSLAQALDDTQREAAVQQRTDAVVARAKAFEAYLAGR